MYYSRLLSTLVALILFSVSKQLISILQLILSCVTQEYELDGCTRTITVMEYCCVREIQYERLRHRSGRRIDPKEVTGA
jgi:hypothetical protein